MKKAVLIIITFLTVLPLLAQEESTFGITWSGYVKNDFFFDSRQTVAAREGHFLLWPAPVKADINGEDINARPNFNMLAVQSRLKAAISGPDAFGAKTSGLIEADFFAQENANINLLRLRHAFVQFNWTHLEVLAGQYWNPLFVTDCFPGTVSFNTGAPLQSFARNPQLRLSYKSGDLKFMAAALSQRDYSSRGEIGVSSSYLRNSAMPDMHLQAMYSPEDANGNTTLNIGAGIAYKTIVPRLNSSFGPVTMYKVDEKVGGITAIAFMKVVTAPFTVKAQARYGENIADVLAISGFAIKDVVDNITGELSYTPLKSMTFWGEIHTNGTKVQAGLFGGFSKNMGTTEAMSDPDNDVYGLATDIHFLYRVSPRLIINSGKARLAFELEYTAAAYGEDRDVYYIPGNTTMANNLRALIAVYYFF
ncbi:MAG: hypothetical protein KFF49_04055 [Bacteroidales bacterium]|nr:hypothetical protein [Bacteroidales bacterium]